MREGVGRSPNRLKVGFVLARSFTLSAFSLFIDTLRLAGDEADLSRRIGADWEVMASSAFPIPSSCGIKVSRTSAFIDPADFDYIVVVGGLLSAVPAVDGETISYLKMADTKRVPLIGLCTGSFILAEAGLMRSHEACVSWVCHDAFRERFPTLKARSDRIFSLERDRGTCAGGVGSADLAAAIVRRHLNSSAERNALELLQIEHARRGSDTQTRRPLSIETDDARLKAALLIMERNADGRVTSEALATAVGISRRQLERLFVSKVKATPGAIYRRLRLERAKHLLGSSTLPLIQIAMEVGYESSSHFARDFRREFGLSPKQCRLGIEHA